MIRISFFIILVFLSQLSFGDSKKLPIPRFASIKSNEVNARAGPAIKSPIEWVFVKKGEPVEIVAEYEQWRQIIDINGEGGWVHSSVLSGKRSVITQNREVLHLIKKPNQNPSVIVAKVKSLVRCQLKKCKDKWCLVRCKDSEGWAPLKDLWGVYSHESF